MQDQPWVKSALDAPSSRALPRLYLAQWFWILSSPSGEVHRFPMGALHIGQLATDLTSARADSIVFIRFSSLARGSLFWIVFISIFAISSLLPHLLGLLHLMHMLHKRHKLEAFRRSSPKSPHPPRFSTGGCFYSATCNQAIICVCDLCLAMTKEPALTRVYPPLLHYGPEV